MLEQPSSQFPSRLKLEVLSERLMVVIAVELLAMMMLDWQKAAPCTTFSKVEEKNAMKIFS
jgi:hypothetical protein